MTNMSIQPLWLTYFIEILLVLEFQLTKTYFGTFSCKAHFRPQISSNSSACYVWESQASLRQDIPASFGSSHILPLFAYDLALHIIGVCSVHVSFLRVCIIRLSLFHFWVIVDLGAALHHYCHLEGILPSTSPPSLGERNR